MAQAHGGDPNKNPFAALIADMMRHAQMFQTTTPQPTTTPTTTTTEKPAATTVEPVMPGSVLVPGDDRMRLNCDGQLFDLIGLDEAIFYTCCGNQVYDRRRYTCYMDEIIPILNNGGPVGVPPGPTATTSTTTASNLPRFISCEGSLWEITDGNPFIECCGDHVYDRRYDSCNQQQQQQLQQQQQQQQQQNQLPQQAQQFFGSRMGRSMPNAVNRVQTQPQLDSIKVQPEFYSMVNQMKPQQQANVQPVCINGQLMATAPGLVAPPDVACCQSAIYSTKTHLCCGGRLFDLRSDSMCCDGAYHTNYNRMLRCCGQRTFDPRTEVFITFIYFP